MHMQLYVRLFAIGIFLMPGLPSWSSTSAQPPEPPEALPTDPPAGVTELIVLLRAGTGHPTPESVVEQISQGQVPPSGIGEGNPSRGKLLINRRATGREHAWNLANPDRASARKQRYIVLGGYPVVHNLRSIGNSLAKNPHVENLEYNLALTLSVTPSDMFFGLPGQSPDISQWGLHIMNFPKAWDLTVGHAYIGIIDIGLFRRHIDLIATDGNTYVGGNYRDHLSINYKPSTLGLEFNCNADEIDPEAPPTTILGHGTHVSGIVAAHTENGGEGVAGACWSCSLLMVKAAEQSFQLFVNDVLAGMDFLMRNGAQVINLSAGIRNGITCTEPARLDLDAFCTGITAMEERNVIMVAAAGNDGSNQWIHFPAVQPEIIGVGGVEYSTTQPEGYEFWPSSNFSPNQDLDVVGPVTTLSTVYTGFDWLLDCGDSAGGLGTSFDGYGRCTGTSMSTPHIAGEIGLVRPTNPLLPNDVIRDIVTTSSSHASNYNSQIGYGLPDVEKAVKKSLGEVGGVTLTNRLTPLFGARDIITVNQEEQIRTHAFTSVPSFLNSLLDLSYETFGVEVPGYDDFPGPPCEPTGHGCPAELIPRAIGYIFTTSTPPNPEAPPLVPLYRLSLDSGRLENCDDQPSSIEHFAYATNMQDVEELRNSGYEVDGIEGYIFESCDAACAQTGAVPLRLLYNSSTGDFLLGPEGVEENGYEPPADAGLNLPTILGHFYEVVDSDADLLIDAFENLIGTSPFESDSDCDSVSDGDEILVYDLSDPNPQNHGYGDPLLGLCVRIFQDGFESGGLTRWSFSQGSSNLR